MAKYFNGILGPFIGKVGTVVGSTWKGRKVMRSLPTKSNHPASEAQLHQQAVFGLCGRFTSTLTPVLQIGLDNMAEQLAITPNNACMRINTTNGAVIGTGTDLSLDYSHLVIARGSGVVCGSPTATLSGNNTVTVTWADNSGISPETLSSDRVCVTLYNESRTDAIYDTDTAVRGDETLTIAYPGLWSGDTSHLYIFTASANGSRVSNSLYITSLTLA